MTAKIQPDNPKPRRKGSIAAFIRGVLGVPLSAYDLPDDGRQRRDQLRRARHDLLVWLATYANPDGTSIRPALGSLERGLGWGKRTIYRRLADLQTLGLLKNEGLFEDKVRMWSIPKECLQSHTHDNGSSVTSSLFSDTSSLFSDTSSQGTTHDPQVDPQVEVSGTPATDPHAQMEREVLGAWNCYLEASGNLEILSASKKKIGLAIVRYLQERGYPDHPAAYMVGVINLTQHLAKKNPKKEYLREWVKMFGKPDTFESLLREYMETPDIPEAAELPAEFQVENGGAR